MSRRRKPQGPEISGILLVDKPAGMTSHDVVDRVRRILHQRSVGHTGTLDPAAMGLLVLCTGGATRFARYLSGMDKTYRAVVRFGQTTDSYDSDGEAVASYDGDLAEVLTTGRLETALAKFQGVFDQVPPAFSAKKIGGVAAYKLARRGQQPELKPVAVRVDRMVISRFEPPDAELEINCAAGFYVRALARDLGEELGTGAHLHSLVRTKVGSFGLGSAVTLEDMMAAGPGRIAGEIMLGLDEALGYMPAVSLNDAAVDEIFFGRQVELEQGAVIEGGAISASGAAMVRMRDSGGAFLGIGELDSFRGGADVLRPRRLLAAAFPERIRQVQTGREQPE